MYALHATLRVPWAQDWCLDCGNCALSYGQKTGDAIDINSEMNFRINLGLVAVGTDGAAVVTGSMFDFSALMTEGTGHAIDSSEGIIVNS